MATYTLKIPTTNGVTKYERTIVSNATGYDEDTLLEKGADIINAYQALTTEDVISENGKTELIISSNEEQTFNAPTVTAGADTWDSEDVLYIKYRDAGDNTTKTARVTAAATPPVESSVKRLASLVGQVMTSLTPTEAYMRSTSDTTIEIVS